jgi:quercetin dioxygenase-like cupin family protein
MSFFSTSELPATQMLEGVLRREVHLDHVMLTFFDFEPGSVVPEHSHPHEQITYVVRGGMRFTLGDETCTLHAGDGVTIPPSVPHGAVVLDEPTLAIDAWYPLREDYL